MGFFSKRKNENDGFVINTDEKDVKISGNKNLAPHAMTPDEVSNLWVFGDDNSPQQTNALDSLKKRMNVSSNIEPPKSEQINLEPQEEPKEEPKETNAPSNQKSSDVVETVKKDIPQKISLTEKVKRYTVDEHGIDTSKSKEPLYRLESVAEIIMSDGETAMKNLSEKYGIDIDLTNSIKPASAESDKKSVKNESIVNQDTTTKPMSAFEQMVSDSEKREAENLYKSIFGADEKEETKIVDTKVADISDIDTLETEKIKNDNVSNTATIRFTPVKDIKGKTDHITISSTTKPIELGDEYFENVSSQSTAQSLEQSEFEKFVSKAEFSDIASGKKYLYRLAVQKRSHFLGMIGSALCVIALLVFLIPPIFNSLIIAKTETAMFICGAILLLSVLANVKMFADFKNLMAKRCGFDAFASLCSVSTLSLALTAALNRQDAYYIILLCAIILFVRAFSKFKEISYIASNLKQILNDKPKKAVTLIGDEATTFSMTKNKIEGDVLAAASRNSVFISDYVKYNEFAPSLSGKGTFLFYFTLVFSVLCGFMAFFIDHNIFVAFYSATVITCLASLPTLFFIDSLPLYSAAKKLNPRGAMIAGMHGAEKIELTNAAVVHINDIFPTGTVKMYSMRVLYDNNIDDTILRAASLTAAVNSPLEAIFNEIAGTNTSYTIPDSDTVKYEKNLGISGWVNNELLFIGNRSFMQAHGIAIPSLEVDKKILRKGYFPVYVATTDIACALIVIQYEAKPEIAKELHKITDLGVTLLIENCDPNITEEMLCDYFDLYEESVKIMSNAGVHMLKNATLDTEKCSAPAVYRGSHLNLVKIINCAARITRSNKLLTTLYVLFAILGMMYFVYAAFSGLMSMPHGETILLYSLGATLLSIIGFLIRKP